MREVLVDVMVWWDEAAVQQAPFARVSSVSASETLEAPTREIVTLYGTPTPESLALALAAALEARKAGEGTVLESGQLSLTEADGAVGDTAFKDRRTGEIIRRELAIPLTVLKETAAELLAEGGNGIRSFLAGLLMPEWPEGTRRAMTLQLATVGAPRSSDALAELREADAQNFVDED